MDVREYFQKVRAKEKEIEEPYVVMVSFETPDGGRAGQMTEVPKGVAAKLLTEGRARRASPEESKAFRQAAAEARQEAERIAAASRMQVAVLSESDLKAFRSAQRPARS